MTGTLVTKLLRDIWVSLVVVSTLLFAFECLWARVTYRVSTEIPDTLKGATNKQLKVFGDKLLEKLKLRLDDDGSQKSVSEILPIVRKKLKATMNEVRDEEVSDGDTGVSKEQLDSFSERLLDTFEKRLKDDKTQKAVAELGPEISKKLEEMMEEIRNEDVGKEMMMDVSTEFFKGPGKIIQALIGSNESNELILTEPKDVLSVGYLHPVILIILSIWAVGRGATAIAGELDRGTMELLLAQPIPRWRVILAHLCVDGLTIPILCLAIWGGSCLGILMMAIPVDPLEFAPALSCSAMLLFAIGGYTMWISSMNRNRGRAMSIAVLVTLLQFLVNVLGQIWEPMNSFRPFTVFYYYDPQQIMLKDNWVTNSKVWLNLGVLLAVGTFGYLAALVTFQRRDLPAPL